MNAISKKFGPSADAKDTEVCPLTILLYLK